MLLFGDYKQLPPATSRPPFIAADGAVVEKFRFRVLRQNRRLVSSRDPAQQARQEECHTTLEDIAYGRASQLVRTFLVEAYVWGAQKNQSNVGFEEEHGLLHQAALQRRLEQKSA